MKEEGEEEGGRDDGGALADVGKEEVSDEEKEANKHTVGDTGTWRNICI